MDTEMERDRQTDRQTDRQMTLPVSKMQQLVRHISVDVDDIDQ